MTTTQHATHGPGVNRRDSTRRDRGRRGRDPVTLLFAAALDGDPRATEALRAAALVSDRAGEALWALASVQAVADLRDPAGEPAAPARLDQVLAFLRPHLAAARAEHHATTGDRPHEDASDAGNTP